MDEETKNGDENGALSLLKSSLEGKAYNDIGSHENLTSGASQELTMDNKGKCLEVKKDVLEITAVDVVELLENAEAYLEESKHAEIIEPNSISIYKMEILSRLMKYSEKIKEEKRRRAEKEMMTSKEYILALENKLKEKELELKGFKTSEKEGDKKKGE